MYRVKRAHGGMRRRWWLRHPSFLASSSTTSRCVCRGGSPRTPSPLFPPSRQRCPLVLSVAFVFLLRPVVLVAAAVVVVVVVVVVVLVHP